MQDEGNFLWVDGSPLTFTNWNGAEGTNMSDNEDCVQMRRGHNGQWGDIACNFSREFLCRESKPFSFSFVWCQLGLKRICRIFGSRSLRNYRSNIRLDTE